jgi:hypothetical protein
MNAERIVRIVAGFFVIFGAGCASQPDFRQRVFPVLYCLCRPESVSERFHASMPAE